MRAASTKPSGAVGCGCSLCNGASGLGTPLCAGERGVEGAGISRGARFVIGASARPECGRPLQNLLVRLVAVVLYAMALLVSERLYVQGSVGWKGREYPVGRDL